MAEASAAGVHPHLFWDYTWFELHVLLQGAQIVARREHRLSISNAWQTANWSKAKKLPDLRQLLRKLEPLRDMSARAIRSAIVGMAEAMGAKVVRKRREE